MNDLSTRIAQLDADRRAPFESLLRGTGRDVGKTTGEPIPRRSDTAELPLSFAQQRLWFLAQLEPDIALYNLPYALLLRGPLDADLLLRSFREIVRRHGVLRTVFETVEGVPVQTVCPPDAFAAQVEDWHAMAGDERAGALTGRVDAEADQPFDVRRDLPLRVALLPPGR